MLEKEVMESYWLIDRGYGSFWQASKGSVIRKSQGVVLTPWPWVEKVQIHKVTF